jgi:hypothetical protein
MSETLFDNFRVGDRVVHKKALELGVGEVTELCPNDTMSKVKWENCDYGPDEAGDWHWNTKLESARMTTLLVTALAEVLLEPSENLTDSARVKLQKLRRRTTSAGDLHHASMRGCFVSFGPDFVPRRLPSPVAVCPPELLDMGGE